MALHVSISVRSSSDMYIAKMPHAVSIGTPMRLGHLPLIMGLFRNIGMAEIIDHAIGQDPHSEVSTGECIATILSGVFVGAHSLWRLSDRLAVYDMQTVMQDQTYDLQRFNEERLAKSLDDLYAYGTDKIMTAVALQAIAKYQLNTSVFRFDTTSLTCYGAYEREDPWSMTDGIEPPPKVTFGHSKAHRPDLKQILFGMNTNDEGIPLMGKALDGNLSDSHAAARFFAKVRELVAHPHDVICVADSKGWCGRVIDIMQQERLRLLSRMPRTRSNHATLMTLPWKPVQTIEVAQRPGKPADRYDIMGFDIKESFEFSIEAADGSKTHRTVTIPARAVRVYSIALLRTKMSSIARLRKREDREAIRSIRIWQDIAYACEADARRAADRNVFQADYATLQITATVAEHQGPAKRGRGRPRKRPEPPLPARQHWRVTYASNAMDNDQVAKRLHEQASFILVRMHTPGWDISDADMLRCYKGQYRIEHGFSWLKSGADINPVYLQTPHRIAALCFIYCLGLMLWTILQRTVRMNLRAWKTGLPYHRNKPSANITTRFLFELFPSVSSVPLTLPDGTKVVQCAGFTDIHRLACKAAGVPESCYNPVFKQ